jgi:hypothetical protein
LEQIGADDVIRQINDKVETMQRTNMKTVSTSEEAKNQLPVDEASASQNQAGYVEPPKLDHDPVDEAGEESFPASDPPSFSGATATPDSPRPDPHPSP